MATTLLTLVGLRCSAFGLLLAAGALPAQSIRAVSELRVTPGTVVKWAREHQVPAVFVDSGFVLWEWASSARRLVTDVERERHASLAALLAAAGTNATDQRVVSTTLTASLLLAPEVELALGSAAVREQARAPARAVTSGIGAWRFAIPKGAYADPHAGAELPALYRATQYLRETLHHWDAATIGAWRAAVAASPEGQAAATRHHRVVAAFRRLFADDSEIRAPGPGAVLVRELVPVFIYPDDAVLEVANLGEPFAALETLLSLDLAASARHVQGGCKVIQESHPDGMGMRSRVLDALHELIQQRPADGIMSGLGALEWAEHRRDAAIFGYVALREIDVLAGRASGMEEHAHQPKLLVEPVPQFFQLMRSVYAAMGDACIAAGLGERYGAREGHPYRWEVSLLSDLITACEHQMRQQDLPPKLHARLLRRIEFPDVSIASSTFDLPDGSQLRRNRAVPIELDLRWQGQPIRALGLRLCTEHRARGAREWRPPDSIRSLPKAPALR